jgi:hypothetical protein
MHFVPAGWLIQNGNPLSQETSPFSDVTPAHESFTRSYRTCEFAKSGSGKEIAGSRNKEKRRRNWKEKKTSDLERDEPNDEGFFYFFLAVVVEGEKNSTL